MKKILIIVFVLLLTSCGDTQEDQREPQNIEVTITYTNEDGTTSQWSMLHIERYISLEDMLKDEYGEFHYFEFLRMEEYSDISNSYYFLDIDSNKEYEVVIYKSMDYFVKGEVYYLHLLPPIEEDFYFLSDLDSSIFYIDGDFVIINEKFITGDSDNKISMSTFRYMISNSK